jgi:uncharacterized protein YkwD
MIFRVLGLVVLVAIAWAIGRYGVIPALAAKMPTAAHASPSPSPSHTPVVTMSTPVPPRTGGTGALAPAGAAAPVASATPVVTMVMGASTVACPGAATAQMLCLTNRARASAHLAGVTASTALMASSRQKAQDIARCGFSHNPCGRPNPLPPCTAEAIFLGTATADDTIAGWLASPPHRAILLGAGAKHAGMAELDTARGRVWVMQLGC